MARPALNPAEQMIAEPAHPNQKQRKNTTKTASGSSASKSDVKPKSKSHLMAQPKAESKPESQPKLSTSGLADAKDVTSTGKKQSKKSTSTSAISSSNLDEASTADVSINDTVTQQPLVVATASPPQVGDFVDAYDSENYAWFQAKVTKIIPSKIKGVPDKYQIDWDLYPEESPRTTTLDAMIPRTCEPVRKADVEVDMPVLVNYNLNSPGKLGFWYEAIVVDGPAIQVDAKKKQTLVCVQLTHPEFQDKEPLLIPIKKVMPFVSFEADAGKEAEIPQQTQGSQKKGAQEEKAKASCKVRSDDQENQEISETQMSTTAESEDDGKTNDEENEEEERKDIIDPNMISPWDYLEQETSSGDECMGEFDVGSPGYTDDEYTTQAPSMTHSHFTGDYTVAKALATAMKKHGSSRKRRH